MNHLLPTKQEPQQTDSDSVSMLATPLDTNEIQTVVGAPEIDNNPPT